MKQIIAISVCLCFAHQDTDRSLLLLSIAIMPGTFNVMSLTFSTPSWIRYLIESGVLHLHLSIHQPQEGVLIFSYSIQPYPTSYYLV